MFNAVIDGKKSMTRRLIKPQPDDFDLEEMPLSIVEIDDSGEKAKYAFPIKPRYKAGEKVFIKEPYFWHSRGGIIGKLYYKYGEEGVMLLNLKWKNKLSMPARYARYFLEITAVRCERLQDISYDDCLQEGIKEAMNERVYHKGKYVHGIPFGDMFMQMYNTPKEAYAALIDSINGKGTWESNPYVWVYAFKFKNK
jgi:hypothetical protein